MKQAAVWKVVLLTLVTFGIYAIYWAAVRRDYIVKHYKKAGPIPRWLWLILIPVLSSMLITGWLVLLILISFDVTAVAVYDATIYPFSIFLYVVPVLIGLWWLWYFGRAIEVITQGRLPRIWSLFLFLFVGPFVIAFHQYYLNRLESLEKGTTYDVSPGLVVFAAVLGILSVAGLLSSIATFPAEVKSVRVELVKAQETMRVSNGILAEYTSCINDLNQRYPDGSLTSENQTEYDAAFARCNVLFDKYTESLNRL